MPKRLKMVFQPTDVDHDQWCWAAVAASVADFKDHQPHRQCVVAGTALNDPNCCVPGNCNKPWYLSKALRAVHHYFSCSPNSISFSRVVTEIDLEQPVGVRIGWTGGGVGHFLAIVGYDETTEKIDLDDPRFGPSTTTIAALETSYQGLGRWTDTYFTF
jgi:hypothetical protein